MVIWSQYLQNLADVMNSTPTEAGIISSLIIMIGTIMVILIATRGKGAITTVPMAMFFLTLFFTYLGWFPVWTGSVIALILVIFIGYMFSIISGVP